MTTINIGFQKVGISERYFLAAGTLGAACIQAYTLCQLRTFWLGTGCVIDKCSVSDIARDRNSLPVGVAGLGCPYPVNTAITGVGLVDAPNDPAVGFMFRLSCPLAVQGQNSGWFQNRILRFIPDAWENNNFPLIVVPQGLFAAVKPIYGNADYDFPVNVLNDDQSLAVPYNSLQVGFLGANYFINFLVKYTRFIHLPFQAGQGPNVIWDNCYYYKVAVRRAGKRYEQPKGRFG